MDAKQILDREFLDIRAKILEVGAALDRLDRAAGSLEGDSRMELLQEAIRLIASETDQPERAEKIQLLFSRPYDASWLNDYQLATRT